MRSLELRIPPPVVALLLAGAMWLVSTLMPRMDVPAALRIGLAIALAMLGGAFSAAGLLAFRRAKTTVNPLHPEKASALVTAGVYRFTRNPMYVGLLLVLLAWVALLASLEALVGPVAFVLYLNRFQIGPEERVLATKFGREFEGYKARVRRWL